jgi:hypothetical protein
VKTRQTKGGLRAERAIASPNQDLLDRCWFSRAVADLVISSDLPVAVAILGEWGTGKTSILRLIQHGASDKAVCLYYNAWKNECGVGSGHGLLRSLVAELTEDAESKAQVPSLLEGFGERDAIGTDSFEHLLSQHVSKALKKRQSERIVLLLDDLDRCRPDALVSLLEALGLYVLASDIPVAVIATLDESRAAQAYERALGLESDGEREGRQYLTRVFSIMLGLPAVAADGWRAIIEDRFPALKSEMSKEDRFFLSNAIGLASYTVRELKHHLNQVAFWEVVAKSDSSTESLSLETLLRWYFLTVHDATLWGVFSGGVDKAKTTLEIRQLAPTSVDNGRASSARDQVLSSLMSSALLDGQTLKRLGALGRHIGRMPPQPYVALDSTSPMLKGASWRELQTWAEAAKTIPDLVQVVNGAVQKPVDNVDDCIVCSNIAIECQRRSLYDFAEVFFSKAVEALDEVEDPRPHEGTAAVLTSFVLFLTQTGQMLKAKELLNRVDCRNPDLSRMALNKILQFAGVTEDGDLREAVFGNLMAAGDLEPEDFATAVREYLAQQGTDPDDVVPHIDNRYRVHRGDALWEWACAEGFACAIAKSEDPKGIEARFIACAEEALAKVEFAVPDAGLCVNALARLADLKSAQVLYLLKKMRQKGDAPASLLMTIAKSSKVLSAKREFKKLLQEALPPLER